MTKGSMVSNLKAVLGVTLLSLMMSRPCYAQPLFTFGDSSYDVGNKKFLTSASVPATNWPYGLSTDRPNGRWSDGRIVPDFIGEFFGIPPLSPILDDKGNFSHGASFAVADATVLGAPKETMTLTDQVLKLVEHKGKWTEQEKQKAVYMIHIGANDYLNYTKANPSATAAQQQEFVYQVIDGLVDSLKALYEAGARKFAFQNLPPLGCFPIVKQEQNSGEACVEKFNSIATLHNKALRPTLKLLASKYPAFQYNVYDFYSSIIRRVDDPWHYRYFTADMSCCGIGTHNAFGCGFKNVHSNLCTYQRGYLWYDGRHNAEKSNEAFGHLFFAADKDIVGPMNLRELSVYPIDLSMLES